MTPLLACFPVCLTFVAIGIVAAVVVAFGMYSREPLTGEEAANPDAPPSGRPPLWVLPLMLLVAALLMLVLGWLWPE